MTLVAWQISFLAKHLPSSAFFPLAREKNHCESYADAKYQSKMGMMAEYDSYPSGRPAMDYARYEKTYQKFPP